MSITDVKSIAAVEIVDYSIKYFALSLYMVASHYLEDYVIDWLNVEHVWLWVLLRVCCIA